MMKKSDTTQNQHSNQLYNYQSKYIKITLIISILMMILVSNTYALGIIPSKRVITFEQYKQHISDGYSEYIIDSTITNTDNKDTAVSITSGGELSEYITIIDSLVYLNSDVTETSFSYKMELPDELEPGIHTANIQISEYDIGIGPESGSSVGGIITVTQQLVIEVPYIGKYLDGYLSAYAVDEDDNVIVSAFSIYSKGTEDVEGISVNLQIKDSYGNVIHTKDFGPYALSNGQSIKVEDQMVMKDSGAYVIEYHAYYDGKELTAEKGLDVGEYGISVLGTKVDNFRLGTIAKFDINVGTEWNAPITGIEGVVTIKDMDGNIVDTINTEKVTLDSRNGAITAYWDTTNVRTGQYIISIVLRAGDKLITQEYITEVKENNIKVIDPATKNDDKTWLYRIIMAVSLVAVLIILASIIVLRRKKRT